jgi:hypothetical protein
MVKSAVIFAATIAAFGWGAPALASQPANSSRQVIVIEDRVVITSAKPGGVTAIEIYETADRSSAKRLSQRLSGASAVTLMQAPYYECPTQYGGAQFTSNTKYCITPYSWTYNGYVRPQVYFNDHTPAQWPVSQATGVWNQSSAIDSWWTIGCPSPSTGKHCVEVWNADYGPDWKGHTGYDVDASNHFIDGTVYVQLNDRFWTSDDNRGTTCHELGHALGLAHNRNNRSSCIFTFSIDGPDPK